MGNMTHPHAWYGTWYDECDAIGSEVCRHELCNDLFICAMWLSAIRHIDITGWRRPIGCLKLQVIFRKRANNHRTLLRRITYTDTASYGSSTPCMSAMHLVAMSFATLSVMTRACVRCDSFISLIHKTSLPYIFIFIYINIYEHLPSWMSDINEEYQWVTSHTCTSHDGSLIHMGGMTRL